MITNVLACAVIVVLGALTLWALHRSACRSQRLVARAARRSRREEARILEQSLAYRARMDRLMAARVNQERAEAELEYLRGKWGGVL